MAQPPTEDVGFYNAYADRVLQRGVTPLAPDLLAPEGLPKDIQSESKRMRDADWYNQQFGIPPSDAYDLQEELNEIAFGKKELPSTPGELFVAAFKQSMADKPAMMLKGATVYTPGGGLGSDALMDKTAVYLQSLSDPQVSERLMQAADGKRWPIGDERSWWQVEAKYVPEVINTWATNVGDQIPIFLVTMAGRFAGKAIGKPLGAAAGMAAGAITAGPDPSDVATVPGVAALVTEVSKHLGGAGPLVAMEAGGFMDEAGVYEIDKDIAEKYAKRYGLGAGVIEYSQSLWVLGRYSAVSKTAQKGITKTVLEHILGSGVEGIEEMSQGGLQAHFMKKAMAEMKDRHPEYDKKPPSVLDLEARRREGEIGFGVALLTGLPGTGMSVTKAAIARRQKLQPETKKFLGEPSVQEMTDVAEAKPPEVGTGGVGISVDPTKPEPHTVGPTPTPGAEGKAEDIETEEQAEVAEQELEAEAQGRVAPRLHIGNVTQRMKTK